MSRRVGNEILGWSDDYEVEFFGSPKNNRFYGVELEIDDGDQNVLRRRLNGDERVDNTIFLVEDGSLDNGVEMVSNPMSLHHHKDSEIWKILTNHARNAGYRSHDTSTCGLHVHVSRNALTQDVIDNILFLNERFWQKWVIFSRRKPEEMSRWASKLTSYNDLEVTKQAVKNNAEKGKYNAINLNLSDTIEFRIFKGTLATKTIYATLDLIDYMIDVAEQYANNDGLYIDDIEWKDFIDGISPDNIHLRQYLDKRDLLEDEEVVAKREEEARKKIRKDKLVAEVRGVAGSMLNEESYDESLAVYNDVISEFIEGDEERFHSLNNDRVYGERFVLHSADLNPFGQGEYSDYNEVFTYSSDIDPTEERPEHRVSSGRYHYIDAIASKVFKVNPITLYNHRGAITGTYEYAFLGGGGKMMLCNIRVGSYGSDVTKDVRIVHEGSSIKYATSNESVIEEYGQELYDDIQDIYANTEPDAVEDIPVERFEEYLTWLEDKAETLNGGSPVEQTISIEDDEVVPVSYSIGDLVRPSAERVGSNEEEESTNDRDRGYISLREASARLRGIGF